MPPQRHMASKAVNTIATAVSNIVTPSTDFHVVSQILTAFEPSSYFHCLLSNTWAERKPAQGAWIVTMPEGDPVAVWFIFSVVFGDLNVYERFSSKKLVERIIMAVNYFSMPRTLGIIRSGWQERILKLPFDNLFVFESLVILAAPFDVIHDRLKNIAMLVNHAYDGQVSHNFGPYGGPCRMGDNLPTSQPWLLLQLGGVLIDKPGHDIYGIFQLLRDGCVNLHNAKHAAIQAMCRANLDAYACFLDVNVNTRDDRCDGCTAGSSTGTARRACRITCQMAQEGGFARELKRHGVIDGRMYFDFRTWLSGSVEVCASALLRFSPPSIPVTLWPLHAQCPKTPRVHQVVQLHLEVWKAAVAITTVPDLPPEMIADWKPWEDFWTNPAHVE
ncbi:hypothetical protein MN608_09440 [Microdochium nivale]|nr:hypothetical protein MN608_09440 [Microdochium nivale]